MSHKLFVFDTNVFVSASLLTSSVNSAAIDRAFQLGKIVVSEACFIELTEVLFRKKFDKYLTDERRLQVIQKLERDTLNYKVNLKINACRDPKDNKFLELAATAGASCIVSGDQDLLTLHPFNNIPILSPAEFLKLFCCPSYIKKRTPLKTSSFLPVRFKSKPHYPSTLLFDYVMQ